MQKQLAVSVIVLILCHSAAYAQKPSADLYFSFDNHWCNKGNSAFDEAPFRAGSIQDPAVQLAQGISGQAFDGLRFTACQPANVPIWGTDQTGLPDTEIEKLFEGARSFTVTAWIKTEELQSQGRLLKTPAFQINYRGDRLETGFAKPKKWFSSEISHNLFDSVGRWRFVAVCWQSTGAGGVIHYYTGTENSPVVSAGSVDTDWSVLSGNETGCWLSIGNSEPDGNRPFAGLIDELRIWVSKDVSAVLLSDALNQIRFADVKNGK